MDGIISEIQEKIAQVDNEMFNLQMDINACEEELEELRERMATPGEIRGLSERWRELRSRMSGLEAEKRRLEREIQSLQDQGLDALLTESSYRFPKGNFYSASNF